MKLSEKYPSSEPCSFKICSNGCTFHKNGLCELYGTGIQPLECRFCHHTRKGLGKKCHAEIEKEWTSKEARRLIVRSGNIVGLWAKNGLLLNER